MVAKIGSGSSMYGVLAYNQEKVDNEHAKVIFTNRMIEPKSGSFDIGICMRSFEPYLLANRRTEKPVLHISINPDPKDNLSDEQLTDIAQEYMQGMGYGDQPYIVYKHEDIERKHVHIVSLRVDENGRKLDHNYERKRSMDICRSLEQKYGLVPADRKLRQDISPLKPVKYEEGDIKHQIANVIRPIAQEYHFQSLKEYKALLSFYRINVEEVRGEVKGRQYRGLVYSALNSRDEKVGNPFNSSLFGKSVGIDALEKRFVNSTKTIKDRGLKERSKKAIASAMKSHPDRLGFEKELAKNSISVLFRTNDEGRIYGVAFIDHEQKVIFNGSRLGKEFSANVFNDLFTQKRYEPQSKPTEGQKYEPFYTTRIDNDLGVAGLFSLLPLEIHGANSDEVANPRKIRKRRKKHRRQ